MALYLYFYIFICLNLDVILFFLLIVVKTNIFSFFCTRKRTRRHLNSSMRPFQVSSVLDSTSNFATVGNFNIRLLLLFELYLQSVGLESQLSFEPAGQNKTQ